MDSNTRMLEWIHQRNPIFFSPEQRIIKPFVAPVGIIYLLTNTRNGKRYIGQTQQTLEKRWRQHLANALQHNGKCKLLEAAIREFGAEAFSREVLATATCGQNLDQLEEHYIRAMKTRRPHGYNILLGKRGWQAKARKR